MLASICQYKKSVEYEISSISCWASIMPSSFINYKMFVYQ